MSVGDKVYLVQIRGNLSILGGTKTRRSACVYRTREAAEDDIPNLKKKATEVGDGKDLYTMKDDDDLEIKVIELEVRD